MMRFLRRAFPFWLILGLLLIPVQPVAAGEPPDGPDIDATLVVAGETVAVDVNVEAASSTVTINQGDGSTAAVNGYAGSTTNVNVQGEPETVVTVNKATTVTGYANSTTSVSFGTGTVATITEGDNSRTNIQGGANSTMNVSGGPGYTVNLNGTNIQQQIDQRLVASELGQYGADWNENVMVMNRVVLPTLANLAKNTDLIANAVARLINDGKMNATDVRTLSETLAQVSAECQQLTALQATLANDLTSAQGIISRQQALIDALNARVAALEEKEAEREKFSVTHQMGVWSSFLSTRLRTMATTAVTGVSGLNLDGRWVWSIAGKLLCLGIILVDRRRAKKE